MPILKTPTNRPLIFSHNKLSQYICFMHLYADVLEQTKDRVNDLPKTLRSQIIMRATGSVSSFGESRYKDIPNSRLCNAIMAQTMTELLQRLYQTAYDKVSQTNKLILPKSVYDAIFAHEIPLQSYLPRDILYSLANRATFITNTQNQETVVLGFEGVDNLFTTLAGMLPVKKEWGWFIEGRAKHESEEWVDLAYFADMARLFRNIAILIAMMETYVDGTSHPEWFSTLSIINQIDEFVADRHVRVDDNYIVQCANALPGIVWALIPLSALNVDLDGCTKDNPSYYSANSGYNTPIAVSRFTSFIFGDK